MSNADLPGHNYVWYPCESDAALDLGLRKQAESLAKDSDYPKNNHFLRYKKIHELTKLNMTVEDDINGLIVNNTIIVAVNSNKWRNKNKWVWYRYSSLEDLVTRIFNDQV